MQAQRVRAKDGSLPATDDKRPPAPLSEGKKQSIFDNIPPSPASTEREGQVSSGPPGAWQKLELFIRSAARCRLQ